MKKQRWIRCKYRQPELGEEYNVVWVLDDGGYPVTTTMDWDAIRKRWTDPRGQNDVSMNDKVLYWQKLPSPPKGIPKHYYK